MECWQGSCARDVRIAQVSWLRSVAVWLSLACGSTAGRLLLRDVLLTSDAPLALPLCGLLRYAKDAAPILQVRLLPSWTPVPRCCEAGAWWVA